MNLFCGNSLLCEAPNTLNIRQRLGTTIYNTSWVYYRMTLSFLDRVDNALSRNTLYFRNPSNDPFFLTHAFLWVTSAGKSLGT